MREIGEIGEIGAQKHFYLFVQGKNSDTYTIHKSDAWVFSLSYFLHKHQMKATKTSQAYTVGTHGCV